MEAVLPIEVEIPSLRVLSELKLDEAEWIQSRYDQLNLIEEKRLKAIRHGQMYQKRMMRAYKKKVHPREFREGDLIPAEQEGRAYEIDSTVEQTEDSESYFPEVAVEQIEVINHRSYLSEVAVEQIKINFISLKLQWSSKSYLPEVAAEQTEDNESYFAGIAVDHIEGTNYGGSYLPEVAAEQTEVSESSLPEVAVEWIEAISLISLKLQWSRLKPQISSH
ncbi:putative inactive leucine-rich repeat receptor-like protein kinase [Gossypium australe]|uniref:Putative inactive leucine-rich repeat receptor-like protein kinase n=1 Tax=Gossypium australe TaxID=47621 RepID=A0A5B6VAI7_9ROSI|nr:putative inactive leucine-rich repeat receptor-like protein kinase [Gossypium australe]